MKTNVITTALLSAITFVVVNPTVLADVPPPDDYVEDCTMEKQCQAGKECLECQGSYQDHSNTPVCEKTYAPYGYTKVCQTWGGSFWEEIWCRPVSDVAKQDSDAQSQEDDSDLDSTDAVVLQQPVVCSDSVKDTDTNGDSVTDTDTDTNGNSCSVSKVSSESRCTNELVLFVSVMLILVIRRRRSD